jgi:AmmeMemoRadiSam system protein B
VSPRLSQLRTGLDFMPSPLGDRPGLLIRDPLQYGDQVLVIPPPLVPLLALFDGDHDETDLQEALVALTGEDEVGALLRHFVETLRNAAFLQDETLAERRAGRQAAFAAAPVRSAAHAGSAYPDARDPLRDLLTRHLDNGPSAIESATPRPLGIAAPHVSPEGGWASYTAAYRVLGPSDAGRTAVILGTSHYGLAHRFGLTRKPFATPLGEARPNLELLEWLEQEGGPAVEREDYCHAVEHSIEFQVVFLQHVLGPDVRILPILCGPFSYENERPEDDLGVKDFLSALRELAAREGDRLLFVLGIDMAHIGRRYGDALHARAEKGPLREVRARDAARIERALAGDPDGFWLLVRGEGGDDLNWCGAAPLYTFLRTGGPVRGRRLHYEQWNIDEDSVVTFAGLVFERAPALGGPGDAQSSIENGVKLVSRS